jgi:hypothetical protein
MIALVPFLQPTERAAVLDEARQATQGISGRWSYSSILMALAPRLAEGERANAENRGGQEASR